MIFIWGGMLYLPSCYIKNILIIMDDDLIAAGADKLTNYYLTDTQNQIMCWIILKTKFCEFHNYHTLVW